MIYIKKRYLLTGIVCDLSSSLVTWVSVSWYFLKASIKNNAFLETHLL